MNRWDEGILWLLGTALALVAALLIIGMFAEGAGANCHTRACVERVARKQCSQRRPVPCIRRAALHRRVSFRMLLRKARCESGLNPWAHNPSGSSGLFQFLPSTWGTTPYARRSIWSAKWSALAAAWMHQRGRGNEWSCR